MQHKPNVSWIQSVQHSLYVVTVLTCLKWLFWVSPFLSHVCCVDLNLNHLLIVSPLSDCCEKKKIFWSFLTCQELLWSFSSGRQTGRRSSRSRWRRCRSLHASWGKHQSRFLRGTSRCPWTPLGHNGKTVGVRREEGPGVNQKMKGCKKEKMHRSCLVMHLAFVVLFLCGQLAKHRPCRIISPAEPPWNLKVFFSRYGCNRYL